MKRPHFLRLAAAAGAALPLLGASSTPDPKIVAKAVRDEFFHAWSGYKRFAWGMDEVHPIAGTGSNFFIPAHAFGLSIIEALDTLYVMGFDDEVDACVKWLKANLDFDVDGNVQMFEAVIRMVGGLLAGYYATNERFLLDGANGFGRPASAVLQQISQRRAVPVRESADGRGERSENESGGNRHERARVRRSVAADGRPEISQRVDARV